MVSIRDGGEACCKWIFNLLRANYSEGVSGSHDVPVHSTNSTSFTVLIRKLRL